ncbi:hypothetical protein [Geodermatophilus sp. TF02-6]|uniref:hypothetical protein n=1 Tax=Geodermatophilus sp. TF02-6 TaxID=2250575 RepID=UPI001313F9BF|nr:hypothetical protein [Geodermatophilus sp. TF02-6]
MVVPTLQAGGSLRTPMRNADHLALGETQHSVYHEGLVVANPPSRRNPDAGTLTVLRDEGGTFVDVSTSDAPGPVELCEPFPQCLDLPALLAA